MYRNKQQTVRMALIAWVDADGFGCRQMLDHTPEQQAEVENFLYGLRNARNLSVNRFYSFAVPPEMRDGRYIT